MYTSLVTPRVNLNGTDQADLVKQNTAVADALKAAIKAATLAHPHGRDFQTLPPGTYAQADEASRLRIRALTEILDDYQALALAIFDQK